MKVPKATRPVETINAVLGDRVCRVKRPASMSSLVMKPARATTIKRTSDPVMEWLCEEEVYPKWPVKLTMKATQKAAALAISGAQSVWIKVTPARTWINVAAPPISKN